MILGFLSLFYFFCFQFVFVSLSKQFSQKRILITPLSHTLSSLLMFCLCLTFRWLDVGVGYVFVTAPKLTPHLTSKNIYSFFSFCFLDLAVEIDSY